MSRTYRRKELYNANLIPAWVYREHWLCSDEFHSMIEKYGDSIETVSHSSWGHDRVDIWFGKNSKEGKRRLAKYRSEADTDKWKRPCGWWVAETVQRPYRRKAKNELRKFMLDTEYEYMIESMPQLGYWN